MTAASDPCGSEGKDPPKRPSAQDLPDTVAWRSFANEARDRLAALGVADPAAEARWMIEEVSGHDGGSYHAALDMPATRRGVAALDRLLERRETGEPLQYVLGHWAFRSLDLLVDARVLIPRPETEVVVEYVLAAVDSARGRGGSEVVRVLDLGTGSGAIALSVAVERTGVEVWAVDLSPGAVAVARANLAGIGRAGSSVRIIEGDWYTPLPDRLRGAFDVVVSNPPYVPASDDLPPEVERWEPAEALRAGPHGTEAIGQVLGEAPVWLAPGGSVVVEIGQDHGATSCALARSAGAADAVVHPDLTGRDRVLVARWP